MEGENLTKCFGLKQGLTTMNMLSHVFIQIVLHAVEEGIKFHQVLYFSTLISSLCPVCARVLMHMHHQYWEGC